MYVSINDEMMVSMLGIEWKGLLCVNYSGSMFFFFKEFKILFFWVSSVFDGEVEVLRFF